MSYQVSKTPVPTNHVLHLILTLVSCGLWAPVWLVLAIINANTDRTTVTQTYGVQPVMPLQPSPTPAPATGPVLLAGRPAPCVASLHIPWPGWSCALCGAPDVRYGG
jgi:hypothetical protein